MKIECKVKPRSKNNKITEKEGLIIVELKAKAIQGKANSELIKMLKKHFKKRVQILKGIKSTTKIIQIGD